MSSINIHIEHVTRVEGHGNIVLNASNGKVEKVQWQVPEAPRFFESFVRGRPYNELSHLTSRICGICSIGHSLASLKATENAFGVKISEQTRLLRHLALHGETLQSHVLHLGYLIAPDLLGAGSVFPLVKTHKAEVLKIVGLHKLANEMSDLICGRTTHPIRFTVGGFTKAPTEKELKALKAKLAAAVPDLEAVGDVILSLAGKLPAFERDTEYIALTSKDGYAFYDGDIGSTDTGKTYKVKDYQGIVNEYIVPHSTAKFCKHARDSYFAGALARFNLNSEQLSPLAKKWAGKFGLKAKCTNPYMNNVAQLVEAFHCAEDTLALIDKVLATGIKDEAPAKVKLKAGRGFGAVEVPRGILFHDYTYNDKGICTKANCVIPTNQNHGNIQLDMEALAPKLLSKPEKEIELTLEMLVRAYDPCISCSTHYLTVDFKK